MKENFKLRHYLIFWYDRDCSDSAIGRFECMDSNEAVIGDFILWCSENCGINKIVDEACCSDEVKYETSKEIPLHYFSGWIKS